MGALLGLDGEVGMVWRGLSGRGLSRATLCALLLVLLPTSATSPDEAWLPSASAEFRAGGQRKRSLACVVLGLRAGMRGGDGDSGGSMAGAGLQGWELSLDGRLLAAVREGREEALRPLVSSCNLPAAPSNLRLDRSRGPRARNLLKLATRLHANLPLEGSREASSSAACLDPPPCAFGFTLPRNDR